MALLDILEVCVEPSTAKMAFFNLEAGIQSLGSIELSAESEVAGKRLQILIKFWRTKDGIGETAKNALQAIDAIREQSR